LSLESPQAHLSLFWFTTRESRGNELREQDDSPKATASVDVPAAIKRELRILLAEDNPVNQEVGRLILESLNCLVDVVPDGNLAVFPIFLTKHRAYGNEFIIIAP